MSYEECYEDVVYFVEEMGVSLSELIRNEYIKDNADETMLIALLSYRNEHELREVA